jgi:hypothetical protein
MPARKGKEKKLSEMSTAEMQEYFDKQARNALATVKANPYVQDAMTKVSGAPAPRSAAARRNGGRGADSDDDDFEHGGKRRGGASKHGAFIDDDEDEARISPYSNISVADEHERERIRSNYARITPDNELHKKFQQQSGVTPSVGPHPASMCCLLFSIFAFVCLILFSWCFYYDAMYVKLPPMATVNKKGAGDNALGAAFTYFVCAAVSGHYYWKGLKRTKTPLSKTQDEDDAL